jgi:outer membrane protein TolC
MTRVLVALMALMTSAAAASAQTRSTLSLDEAIAIASANNLTLQNAAMQVEKAEHDVAIARTRRMPSFSIESQASQLLTPVDISFPRGAFGDYPGIGPIPSTDATITTPRGMSIYLNAQATQPLSQLFKINLNVRLSEASLAYEREQVRAGRLALVQNVRRQYYAVLETASALEAVAAKTKLLEEMDRVTATRVAQQVVLKSDRLDVQTRLADAELSRLTLGHTLASRKEQLNQLLGRDIRTPFEVAPIPEPSRIETDLQAAQARALDARPDIRQARVRLQQAELAHRVSKADRIPELALTASSLMPINIDGAPGNISTVAIQAKWDVFDWGRKGRAVAAKGLEIRQAKNSMFDAEQKAVLEINNEFRRVEAARAQLRVARLAQEHARENARVRMNQYEVRAALLSDVMLAESNLADSDDQYTRALLSFWTALADLDHALGEE